MVTSTPVHEEAARSDVRYTSYRSDLNDSLDKSGPEDEEEDEYSEGQYCRSPGSGSMYTNDSYAERRMTYDNSLSPEKDDAAGVFSSAMSGYPPDFARMRGFPPAFDQISSSGGSTNVTYSYDHPMKDGRQERYTLDRDRESGGAEDPGHYRYGARGGENATDEHNESMTMNRSFSPKKEDASAKDASSMLTSADAMSSPSKSPKSGMPSSPGGAAMFARDMSRFPGVPVHPGAAKEEFDAHMAVHFEFNCPHCDYTSRTEGRLKRHIKDFHTESDNKQRSMPGRPKVYRCKQCEFSCINKVEFWAHARTHIKEDKLLQCPRCPFVTEYKHHLEYHLRNHFGSKPFKCTKCNYSCVNKSMLNSHMKSHTNVYQYRCADCTYATKYCHSLKLHLRKYGHKPATVLNSDGSLPQGIDAEISGLSLLAKRGPPRGPRGLRKEKDGGLGDPFMPPTMCPPMYLPPGDMPPMNSILSRGMMPAPYWPMIANSMHPPPPLIPVGGMGGPRQPLMPGFEKLNGMPGQNIGPEPDSGNSERDSSSAIKCKMCSYTAETIEGLEAHVLKIHAAENRGYSQHSMNDAYRRNTMPTSQSSPLRMHAKQIISDLMKSNPASWPRYVRGGDEEGDAERSSGYASANPRKRSRKGKAYKLDALCLKLQEKQAVSPYGSDSEELPQSSEMARMRGGEEDLDEENHYQMSDSFSDRRVERAVGTEHPDRSSEMDRSQNENAESEAAERGENPPVMDMEFEQLQKNIQILNSDVQSAEECSKNMNEDASLRQQDRRDETPSGELERHMSESSPPPQGMGEAEVDPVKERVSLISAIYQSQHDAVPPAVRRGTELALKIFNETAGGICPPNGKTAAHGYHGSPNPYKCNICGQC
nr:hypothetical protein BaRGS_011204 [Batillaria attramentaria]